MDSNKVTGKKKRARKVKEIPVPTHYSNGNKVIYNKPITGNISKEYEELIMSGASLEDLLNYIVITKDEE